MPSTRKERGAWLMVASSLALAAGLWMALRSPDSGIDETARPEASEPGAEESDLASEEWIQPAGAERSSVAPGDDDGSGHVDPETPIPAAPRRTAEGLAVDVKGAPVPGVEVHVSDPSGGAAATVTADAAGRFAMADGWHVLGAKAEGLNMVGWSDAGASEDGETQQAIVVMAAMGQLRVRVESAAGDPQQGVPIEIDLAQSLLPASAQAAGREARNYYPFASKSAGGPTVLGVPRGVQLELRVGGTAYRLVESGLLVSSPTASAEPLRIPLPDSGAPAELDVVVRLAAESSKRESLPGVLAIEGTVTTTGSPEGVFAFLDPLDIGEAHCAPRWTVVARGGGFRFDGLPPGNYRVSAFQRSMARTVLEPVLAGGPPVTLRLDRERPTTVEIDLQVEGAEIKTWRVHVWNLDASAEPQELTGDTPLLPELWPDRALPPDVGRITPDFPEPLTFSDSLGGAGPTVTLRLERKTAWFGVTATSTAGEALSAVSTGPVRLRPGVTQLTARLVPTATLRGSAPGARAPFAALYTPSGTPLSLPTASGAPQALAPVDAAGRFSFERVPFGNYEVRVGTALELGQGGALLTGLANVKGGSPAALVLGQ